MTNQVINISKNGSDNETGLVVTATHNANSGFQYLAGVREFENLKIVEGVSKGTASIFLTSLMVFDQHDKLIYDAPIKRMRNYSRETARQMVLNGLVEMLREAAESQNMNFDELNAYQTIDAKLKTAYFKISYEAVLHWAKEIGIEIS